MSCECFHSLTCDLCGIATGQVLSLYPRDVRAKCAALGWKSRGGDDYCPTCAALKSAERRALAEENARLLIEKRRDAKPLPLLDQETP